jgi:hypothetical protein
MLPEAELRKESAPNPSLFLGIFQTVLSSMPFRHPLGSPRHKKPLALSNAPQVTGLQVPQSLGPEED